MLEGNDLLIEQKGYLFSLIFEYFYFSGGGGGGYLKNNQNRMEQIRFEIKLDPYCMQTFRKTQSNGY